MWGAVAPEAVGIHQAQNMWAFVMEASAPWQLGCHNLRHKTINVAWAAKAVHPKILLVDADYI